MSRFTVHVSFLSKFEKAYLLDGYFQLNDYSDPAATYTALCERLNMLPFLRIDAQVAQLRNGAEEAQKLIGELPTFASDAANQRDDLTKRAKTARAIAFSHQRFYESIRIQG
jgi:hypothetical protein